MAKAIAIDLGGTNLRAALVDDAGNILKKERFSSTDGDVRETLKAAVDALMERGVKGVGIGVAGIMSKERTHVVVAPNLPRIEGWHIGDDLGLKVPVLLENDANCAALGELWRGGGQHESFVLMTLGTGIGAGFVHEGRLMHVAAEVGHMSINADGPSCHCGGHGCLEGYASARAIAGAAIAALGGGQQSLLSECCKGNVYRITPEDIYGAAFEGDALSRAVLRDAGRYLGVGMANIINLMSPGAVVLTGGLIGAWDIYVNAAINEAARRTCKGLFEGVEVLRSSLGPEDAGILGAAALVLK